LTLLLSGGSSARRRGGPAPQAEWVFVYTREAHPGENVGYHDSIEAKLACARLLHDEAGISRDILVDDLSGSVHRAYGLMPNMTWVIDRGGRVAYKADWTSAPNVEAFLGRFLAARDQRSPGTTTVIYQTQQVEFRQTDRALHRASAAQWSERSDRIRAGTADLGAPERGLSPWASQCRSTSLSIDITGIRRPGTRDPTSRAPITQREASS
jgi:hypothetical protein